MIVRCVCRGGTACIARVHVRGLCNCAGAPVCVRVCIRAEAVASCSEVGMKRSAVLVRVASERERSSGVGAGTLVERISRTTPGLRT